MQDHACFFTDLPYELYEQFDKHQGTGSLGMRTYHISHTRWYDFLAMCMQGQAKDGSQSAVAGLDKAWPSAQQAVQAAINTLKPQTSPLPHKDE